LDAKEADARESCEGTNNFLGGIEWNVINFTIGSMNDLYGVTGAVIQKHPCDRRKPQAINNWQKYSIGGPSTERTSHATS
jgi:hypothetical protein